MEYYTYLIICILAGAFLGVMGLLFKLLYSKCQGVKHRKKEMFSALHELTSEANEISPSEIVLTSFPAVIIEDERADIEEEEFDLRIFSTERPKKIATKSSDSIDPALGNCCRQTNTAF